MNELKLKRIEEILNKLSHLKRCRVVKVVAVVGSSFVGEMKKEFSPSIELEAAYKLCPDSARAYTVYLEDGRSVMARIDSDYGPEVFAKKRY
jgi:divalent metal cation (Fe/Co/Zn/Cd) transporter